MNETKNLASERRSATAENESGLLDFLIVLAKHKKTLIGLPFGVAVTAAAITLALPNVYRTGAKLLPPQQAQSGAAALLSQLGGAAGVAASAAGIKNPNDLYVGMLKSRTVGDRMVARFDLKKVYETDSLEKARSKLESNTFVVSGKDGLIAIEVEGEDKKLVAPMANAYVEELMRLTSVLAVTEAGQRRLFYERQLENAKNKLAAAEARLKGGLERQGVVSVDADSRAILETVSRLRAQISAKEIQLGSMAAFVTKSNPDYRRVEEELGSLRSELSKLENGRPDAVSSKNADNGSEGLESIKMLRDVKYYQMLYELLAKQYEVARLDESKDNSIIQVLDKAVEPERKYKPKRAVIVIAFTFISLLLAVGMAFLSEAKQRLLRTTVGRSKWDQLRACLRFS